MTNTSGTTSNSAESQALTKAAKKARKAAAKAEAAQADNAGASKSKKALKRARKAERQALEMERNLETQRAKKSMTGKLQAARQKGAAVITELAMAIAMALTCPGAFKPFRYPAGSYETAVFKAKDCPPAAWQTTDDPVPNQPFLLPSDLPAFSFRNPLRSRVYFDANVGGKTSTYNWFFGNSNSAAPTAQFFLAPAVDGSDNQIGQWQSVWVAYASVEVGSQWAPHGNILYCGQGKNAKQYIWIDGGATLTVTGPGTTPISQFYAQLYQWTTADEELAGGPTISSGGPAPAPQTVTFTSPFVDEPGYYRVEVRNLMDSVFPVTISQSLSGSSGVWCHLPVPELTSFITSISNIRTLAMSLMYTETASVEKTQGQLVANQIVKSTPWYETVVADGYSGITQMPGCADPMDIKKGEYVYGKPENTTVFEFANNYVLKNGLLAQSYYPILPEYDYLVLWANVTDSASRNGLWTFWYALEFTSLNQVFDLEKAKPVRAAYQEALDFLETIPQVTENPTHFGDIVNWVVGAAKSAGNFILEKGPTLLELGRIAAEVAAG